MMVKATDSAPTSGVRGAGFRRLWAATGAANLGDGLVAGAAPLLAAALTRDPVLVSGLVVAQRLPWFLFTLHSGVLVDRRDRRQLMLAANIMRAAALGGLSVALAAGFQYLAVLYAAVFLMGTSETIVDNAALAVLPALVTHGDLERANSRIFSTQSILDRLVGPPAGAALFALAAVSAFATATAAYALAAAVIAAIPSTAPPGSSASSEHHSVTAEIRHGLRWFWRHRLLRTVAIMAGTINFFSAATLGVLVLVAQERLGIHETGYGLLLSAAAVGGIIGAAAAPGILARFGQGPVIVWLEIALPAAAAAGIAATTDPYVAALLLAIDAFGTGIGNVIVITLRQAAVPDELLGRVTSAYRLIGLGALPLGAIAGGIAARSISLTAPFWATSIGLTLLAVAVAPVLTTEAYQHAVTRAADPPTEQTRA